MTGKQFQSLITRYILPHVSGYAVKGGLLWKQPLDLYLRGIQFEPSRWDKNEFNAVAFIQPLYIPLSYLVFSVGDDLGIMDHGGQKWWQYDPSTVADVMSDVLRIIRESAAPWLQRMNTPDDFVEYVRRTPYGGINAQQKIVYSYILAGNRAMVARTFEEIERSYAGETEPIYQWVHDRYAECMEMKDLYARDPREAVKRLLQYRVTTLDALKLREYAVVMDERVED